MNDTCAVCVCANREQCKGGWSLKTDTFQRAEREGGVACFGTLDCNFARGYNTHSEREILLEFQKLGLKVFRDIPESTGMVVGSASTVAFIFSG